jgi:hypothetical protein
MNVSRERADIGCTWSADGQAIRAWRDGWVTRGELPFRLMKCRNASEARDLAMALAGRHPYEHGLIIEAFRLAVRRPGVEPGDDPLVLTRMLARQLLSRGEREAGACSQIGSSPAWRSYDGSDGF